jgi:hypothetical protein
VYYEHGDIVSEDTYVDGLPHGVWVAYSLHHRWSFATCFDHGKRIWQLVDRAEAARRSCP